MGGSATPGVGWASGVERLSMLVQGVPEKRRPIAVVPLGGSAEEKSLVLTEKLRREGISVDIAYRGKVKQRMKRANNINACAAVIIGEEELTQGAATVRDLDSGEQKLVSFENLQRYIQEFYCT